MNGFYLIFALFAGFVLIKIVSGDKIYRTIPPAFVIACGWYVAMFYLFWSNEGSQFYEPLLAKYWWNPISMTVIISFLTITFTIPVAFFMAPWGLLGYADEE